MCVGMYACMPVGSVAMAIRSHHKQILVGICCKARIESPTIMGEFLSLSVSIMSLSRRWPTFISAFTLRKGLVTRFCTCSFILQIMVPNFLLCFLDRLCEILSGLRIRLSQMVVEEGSRVVQCSCCLLFDSLFAINFLWMNVFSAPFKRVFFSAPQSLPRYLLRIGYLSTIIHKIWRGILLPRNCSISYRVGSHMYNGSLILHLFVSSLGWLTHQILSLSIRGARS